jgi:hypothetical protein
MNTGTITAAFTMAVALTGRATAPASPIQPTSFAHTAATSSTSAVAAVLAATEAATITSQVKAGNQAIKDLAKNQGWQYKTFEATICLRGKPFWGRKHDSPDCALAHLTLTGEVAYNGKEVWGQRVDTGLGSMADITVKRTWRGFWNNGAQKHPYFMDLGANGHARGSILGQTIIDGDFYIRIDVYPNGTARLRGGPG